MITHSLPAPQRSMMKQHLFLLFSLLLVMTSCKTPLEVSKATQQEWFGGAAGSGGGIRYVVHVKKDEKGEVAVDKVWVGSLEKGQWVPFRFFNDSSRTTTMMVPEGFTQFRVEFDERIQGQRPPNMEEYDENSNSTELPNAFPEGFDKGVVLYLKDGNGKVTVLGVEEFERLEPLAYP